ncbi:MAG: MoaD/ThiS family protein [Burkholderiales bacterium]|nr:MoaD/ThiS family protein [Burkholderiales bacterium]
MQPAFCIPSAAKMPMLDYRHTTPATVTVRLVFLARLREAFGRSEESLTVTGSPPTVGAVLALLRARDGVWARELGVGRAFRVAVNHAVAAEHSTVRDADEVALLPPVTGG